MTLKNLIGFFILGIILFPSVGLFVARIGSILGQLAGEPFLAMILGSTFGLSVACLLGLGFYLVISEG